MVKQENGACVMALDSSGRDVSVALLRTGAGARLIERSSEERGSRALHGLVDAVLDEAGVEPAELAAFGVVRGPGSFTGIRVGLAAGLGFAFSWDIQLSGMESGLVLAAASALGEEGDRRVVSILEGGQGRVFLSVHEREGGAWRTSASAVDVPLAGAVEAVDGLPSQCVLRGSPAGTVELVAQGARCFDGPLAGAAAQLLADGVEQGPALPLYAREPSIRPPARPPGLR